MFKNKNDVNLKTSWGSNPHWPLNLVSASTLLVLEMSQIVRTYILFISYFYVQYVLVKFLGARQESAERIGVLGIQFFGYKVQPNCPLSEDLNLVITWSDLQCQTVITVKLWNFLFLITEPDIVFLCLSCLKDEVAPGPAGNVVDGSTLFIRVLSFLDEMAKDQVLQ